MVAIEEKQNVRYSNKRLIEFCSKKKNLGNRSEDQLPLFYYSITSIAESEPRRYSNR